MTIAGPAAQHVTHATPGILSIPSSSWGGLCQVLVWHSRGHLSPQLRAPSPCSLLHQCIVTLAPFPKVPCRRDTGSLSRGYVETRLSSKPLAPAQGGEPSAILSTSHGPHDPFPWPRAKARPGQMSQSPGSGPGSDADVQQLGDTVVAEPNLSPTQATRHPRPGPPQNSLLCWL